MAKPKKDIINDYLAALDRKLSKDNVDYKILTELMKNIVPDNRKSILSHYGAELKKLSMDDQIAGLEVLILAGCKFRSPFIKTPAKDHMDFLKKLEKNKDIETKKRKRYIKQYKLFYSVLAVHWRR